MSDKLDDIKESSEIVAERMDRRKDDIEQSYLTLVRRLVVDLLGIGGAIALVVYTDGLVWLLVALLIGAISLWGLFWKVVGVL
jgi:hypothetical protein